jgi:hypothetical protein
VVTQDTNQDNHSCVLYVCLLNKVSPKLGSIIGVNMAKPLTTEQIEAIDIASNDILNLNPLQVYVLATAGLIESVDGNLVLTTKANRAVKRTQRNNEITALVPIVSEEALSMLSTIESTTTNRQIFESLAAKHGADRFASNQIYAAMSLLREEGILTNDGSGNNFQSVWRRGPNVPQLEVVENTSNEDDGDEVTMLVTEDNEVSDVSSANDYSDEIVIDL